MKFMYDDGGRKAAGFKGEAGDCVCRAICIAARLDYKEVYDRLADGTAKQRATKRTGKRKRSARNGINCKRKWFKDYMGELGFVWTPTMLVGSGCKVHLAEGELPEGRLVVQVSKHLTAVVDQVVRDTHDPRRDTHYVTSERRDLRPGEKLLADGKIAGVSKRCVYGYWTLN